MDALFIMTVNARGNCQHGSIVKQSVGILSRNLSISLISKHSKMFYTVSNPFSFFYNFDNNYKLEWIQIIYDILILFIDIVIPFVFLLPLSMLHSKTFATSQSSIAYFTLRFWNLKIDD